jgi:putative inorganic carbon (HCO3(-)) transporter
MKLLPVIREPAARRLGLVVVAVVMVTAVAASGAFYRSPYAPAMVAGAFAAAAALVICIRKPIWALYAALFIVLLRPGLIPSGAQSLLNRSLTIVALATWLFDVLARHRRVQWNSTATFMLGFLAWSMVTLFWADSLSSATSVLQAFVLRFILFLILIPNEIRTRETLSGLMSVLALLGWVFMLITARIVLLQGYTPGTRLSVLAMNENGLGVQALVTMIGVLWLAMQPAPQHKWLKKLAAWVFLFMTIAVVAMSGSRGGAISLVVTLMAFCLWRPTRPWGVVGLLVLALGAILVPFLFSTTLQRFVGTPGDTLLGGREALWQAGFRLILDHPWGGVGIGNSAYAVMPYLRPLRSVFGYGWAAIHNPILTVWAETGMLGILLYLGVMGSAVWSFAQQYRRHRRSGPSFLTPYFALVASAFLGYMVAWIKGGGMESDHSYFLMLALLVIPSCLQNGESADHSGPEKVTKEP